MIKYEGNLILLHISTILQLPFPNPNLNYHTSPEMDERQKSTSRKVTNLPNAQSTHGSAVPIHPALAICDGFGSNAQPDWHADTQSSFLLVLVLTWLLDKQPRMFRRSCTTVLRYRTRHPMIQANDLLQPIKLSTHHPSVTRMNRLLLGLERGRKLPHPRRPVEPWRSHVMSPPRMGLMRAKRLAKTNPTPCHESSRYLRFPCPEQHEEAGRYPSVPQDTLEALHASQIDRRPDAEDSSDEERGLPWCRCSSWSSDRDFRGVLRAEATVQPFCSRREPD